jgi:hypothetical protein
LPEWDLALNKINCKGENQMEETIVTGEPIAEATINPNEVMASIVKYDDGYHVVDKDGTVGPVLNITKDGISFILTPNASNRKYMAVKAVEKALAEADSMPLYYKGTKVLGPQGSRTTALPNAKLIAYLSEEEQEEYKAIIARAIAARDADKKKPMTELEKAQAKLAKAQAALEKLMAQAEGGNA